MVKNSSSYTDSISLIKSDKGIPHRKIRNGSTSIKTL